MKPTKPDKQDIERVEREEGPLPENASDEQLAHRYWLYQAAKLIRLYEHGKLPLALMREMDQIPRSKS